MSQDVSITYSGGWKELNAMRFSLGALVALNVLQSILLGLILLGQVSL